MDKILNNNLIVNSSTGSDLVNLVNEIKAKTNIAIDEVDLVGTAAQIISGTNIDNRRYSPADINSAIDTLIANAAPATGTKDELDAGIQTSVRLWSPSVISAYTEEVASSSLFVDSTSELKSVSVASGDVRIVKGIGSFTFNASDLSSNVTVDVDELKYIAPTSDATGASGAWVKDGLIQASGTYDFSGVGVFTSGTVDVVRIGNTVTVVGNLYHTSSSSPTSLGISPMPYWSDATKTSRSVYQTTSSALSQINTSNLGGLGFTYRDFSGALTTKTTTDYFSFTYQADEL